MAKNPDQIRVAVVGYGTIGKYVSRSIAKAKDMVLVGIFTRRDPKTVRSSFGKTYSYSELPDFVGRIDVVLLCQAVHSGLQETGPQVAKLFNTVDMHPLRGLPPTPEEVAAAQAAADEQFQRLIQRSDQEASPEDQPEGDQGNGSAQTGDGQPPQDGQGEAQPGASQEEEATDYGGGLIIKKPTVQPTYASFASYFNQMQETAKASGHYALCAVGWEPGLFSCQRTIFESILPGSDSHTFWGRGVSMDMSNAVRCFPGVIEAIVYQVPKLGPLEGIMANEFVADTSRRAMHHLECYLRIDESLDRESMREQIAAMPGWFADYDTQVTFLTADEMREFHTKFPNAGLIITRDKSDSETLFKLEMDMGDNAGFTALILATCARACARANKTGWQGAGTMVDIPPAWYSPRPIEELRADFSNS